MWNANILQTGAHADMYTVDIVCDTSLPSGNIFMSLKQCSTVPFDVLSPANLIQQQLWEGCKVRTTVEVSTTKSGVQYTVKFPVEFDASALQVRGTELVDTPGRSLFCPSNAPLVHVRMLGNRNYSTPVGLFTLQSIRNLTAVLPLHPTAHDLGLAADKIGIGAIVVVNATKEPGFLTLEFICPELTLPLPDLFVSNVDIYSYSTSSAEVSLTLLRSPRVECCQKVVFALTFQNRSIDVSSSGGIDHLSQQIAFLVGLTQEQIRVTTSTRPSGGLLIELIFTAPNKLVPGDCQLLHSVFESDESFPFNVRTSCDVQQQRSEIQEVMMTSKSTLT
ncbi:MAG: hypothetical protein ACK8QZ_12235, partial [Anaerolineales bacterium]